MFRFVNHLAETSSCRWTAFVASAVDILVTKISESSIYIALLHHYLWIYLMQILYSKHVQVHYLVASNFERTCRRLNWNIFDRKNPTETMIFIFFNKIFIFFNKNRNKTTFFIFFHIQRIMWCLWSSGYTWSCSSNEIPHTLIHFVLFIRDFGIYQKGIPIPTKNFNNSYK